MVGTIMQCVKTMWYIYVLGHTTSFSTWILKNMLFIIYVASCFLIFKDDGMVDCQLLKLFILFWVTCFPAIRRDGIIRYSGEKLWPWQYGSPTAVVNLWLEANVFQMRKHCTVVWSSFMCKLIQLNFCVIFCFLFVYDINWTLYKWSAVEIRVKPFTVKLGRCWIIWITSVNKKQWRRVWFCLFAM
jgi:hypothetical protein